jgi:hypothetical protein
MKTETNNYKADLHGHSKFSDGLSNPSQIVEAAARKGLHILGWSDQDPVRAFGIHGWAEFFSAVAKYNDANPSSPILGMPGIEQSTKGIVGEGDCHVLTYFPDKDGRRAYLLKKNRPGRNQIVYNYIVQMVREYNAICILAHPNFSHISSISFSQLKLLAEHLPDDVRPNIGIEVMNWMTRMFFTSYQSNIRKAEEIASEYDLAAVSFSDYHHAYSVGNHFTNFSMAELTGSAFLEAFKSRSLAIPEEQADTSISDVCKAAVLSAVIYAFNTTTEE